MRRSATLLGIMFWCLSISTPTRSQDGTAGRSVISPIRTVTPPVVITPGPGGSTHIDYNPSVYLGYGVPGFYQPYSPTLLVVGPGGFPPVVPYPVFVPTPAAPPQPQGLLLPPAPPRLEPERNLGGERARQPDTDAARTLTTIGDRLFRGKNFKRAEDRYRQALRVDPHSARPRLRLAQIAIVRERYDQAAAELRAAMTAEPGWLQTAEDVQKLFGEPEEFAKVLGKLETRLQESPDDRDAWFVLGAELYLSGRVKQAADVFDRLNDRKPDVALEAFLEASRPHRFAPNR